MNSTRQWKCHSGRVNIQHNRAINLFTHWRTLKAGPKKFAEKVAISADQSLPCLFFLLWLEGQCCILASASSVTCLYEMTDSWFFVVAHVVLPGQKKEILPDLCHSPKSAISVFQLSLKNTDTIYKKEERCKSQGCGLTIWTWLQKKNESIYHYTAKLRRANAETACICHFITRPQSSYRNFQSIERTCI